MSNHTHSVLLPALTRWETASLPQTKAVCEAILVDKATENISENVLQVLVRFFCASEALDNEFMLKWILKILRSRHDLKRFFSLINSVFDRRILTNSENVINNLRLGGAWARNELRMQSFDSFDFSDETEEKFSQFYEALAKVILPGGYSAADTQEVTVAIPTDEAWALLARCANEIYEGIAEETIGSFFDVTISMTEQLYRRSNLALKVSTVLKLVEKYASCPQETVISSSPTILWKICPRGKEHDVISHLISNMLKGPVVNRMNVVVESAIAWGFPVWCRFGPQLLEYYLSSINLSSMEDMYVASSRLHACRTLLLSTKTADCSGKFPLVPPNFVLRLAFASSPTTEVDVSIEKLLSLIINKIGRNQLVDPNAVFHAVLSSDFFWTSVTTQSRIARLLGFIARQDDNLNLELFEWSRNKIMSLERVIPTANRQLWFATQLCDLFYALPIEKRAIVYESYRKTLETTNWAEVSHPVLATALSSLCSFIIYPMVCLEGPKVEYGISYDAIITTLPLLSENVFKGICQWLIVTKSSDSKDFDPRDLDQFYRCSRLLQNLTFDDESSVEAILYGALLKNVHPQDLRKSMEQMCFSDKLPLKLKLSCLTGVITRLRNSFKHSLGNEMDGTELETISNVVVRLVQSLHALSIQQRSAALSRRSKLAIEQCAEVASISILPPDGVWDFLQVLHKELAEEVDKGDPTGQDPKDVEYDDYGHNDDDEEDGSDDNSEYDDHRDDDDDDDDDDEDGDEDDEPTHRSTQSWLEYLYHFSSTNELAIFRTTFTELSKLTKRMLQSPLVGEETKKNLVAEVRKVKYDPRFRSSFRSVAQLKANFPNEHQEIEALKVMDCYRVFQLIARDEDTIARLYGYGDLLNMVCELLVEVKQENNVRSIPDILKVIRGVFNPEQQASIADEASVALYNMVCIVAQGLTQEREKVVQYMRETLAPDQFDLPMFLSSLYATDLEDSSVVERFILALLDFDEFQRAFLKVKPVVFVTEIRWFTAVLRALGKQYAEEDEMRKKVFDCYLHALSVSLESDNEPEIHLETKLSAIENCLDLLSWVCFPGSSDPNSSDQASKSRDENKMQIELDDDDGHSSRSDSDEDTDESPKKGKQIKVSGSQKEEDTTAKLVEKLSQFRSMVFNAQQQEKKKSSSTTTTTNKQENDPNDNSTSDPNSKRRRLSGGASLLSSLLEGRLMGTGLSSGPAADDVARSGRLDSLTQSSGSFGVFGHPDDDSEDEEEDEDDEGNMDRYVRNILGHQENTNDGVAVAQSEKASGKDAEETDKKKPESATSSRSSSPVTTLPFMESFLNSSNAGLLVPECRQCLKHCGSLRPMYRCYTCFKNEPTMICSACLTSCHKDHQTMFENYLEGECACDSSNCCRIGKSSDGESSNSEEQVKRPILPQAPYKCLVEQMFRPSTIDIFAKTFAHLYEAYILAEEEVRPAMASASTTPGSELELFQQIGPTANGNVEVFELWKGVESSKQITDHMARVGLSARRLASSVHFIALCEGLFVNIFNPASQICVCQSDYNGMNSGSYQSLTQGSIIDTLSHIDLGFAGLQLEFNKSSPQLLAVAGMNSCCVIALTSTGELAKKMTLSYNADLNDMVKRIMWVPNSRSQLCLITGLRVRIFDVFESERPIHSYRLAEEIQPFADAAFLPCQPNVLLLLSTSGCLLRQDLSVRDDEDELLICELLSPPVGDAKTAGTLSVVGNRALIAHYTSGQLTWYQMNDQCSQIMDQHVIEDDEPNSGRGTGICAVLEERFLLCATSRSFRNRGSLAVYEMTKDASTGRVTQMTCKPLGPSQLSVGRIAGITIWGESRATTKRVIVLFENGSLQVFWKEPRLTTRYMSHKLADYPSVMEKFVRLTPMRKQVKEIVEEDVKQFASKYKPRLDISETLYHSALSLGAKGQSVHVRSGSSVSVFYGMDHEVKQLLDPTKPSCIMSETGNLELYAGLASPFYSIIGFRLYFGRFGGTETLPLGVKLSRGGGMALLGRYFRKPPPGANIAEVSPIVMDIVLSKAEAQEAARTGGIKLTLLRGLEATCVSLDGLEVFAIPTNMMLSIYETPRNEGGGEEDRALMGQVARFLAASRAEGVSISAAGQARLVQSMRTLIKDSPRGVLAVLSRFFPDEFQRNKAADIITMHSMSAEEMIADVANLVKMGKSAVRLPRAFDLMLMRMPRRSSSFLGDLEEALHNTIAMNKGKPGAVMSFVAVALSCARSVSRVADVVASIHRLLSNALLGPYACDALLGLFALRPGLHGRNEAADVVTEHDQYQCDSCFMIPIREARWNCRQCDNYDYCEKCFFVSGLDVHDSSHEFHRLELTKDNYEHSACSNCGELKDETDPPSDACSLCQFLGMSTGSNENVASVSESSVSPQRLAHELLRTWPRSSPSPSLVRLVTLAAVMWAKTKQRQNTDLLELLSDKLVSMYYSAREAGNKLDQTLAIKYLTFAIRHVAENAPERAATNFVAFPVLEDLAMDAARSAKITVGGGASRRSQQTIPSWFGLNQRDSYAAWKDISWNLDSFARLMKENAFKLTTFEDVVLMRAGALDPFESDESMLKAALELRYALLSIHPGPFENSKVQIDGILDIFHSCVSKCSSPTTLGLVPRILNKLGMQDAGPALFKSAMFASSMEHLRHLLPPRRETGRHGPETSSLLQRNQRFTRLAIVLVRLVKLVEEDVTGWRKFCADMAMSKSPADNPISVLLEVCQIVPEILLGPSLRLIYSSLNGPCPTLLTRSLLSASSSMESVMFFFHLLRSPSGFGRQIALSLLVALGRELSLPKNGQLHLAKLLMVAHKLATDADSHQVNIHDVESIMFLPMAQRIIPESPLVRSISSSSSSSASSSSGESPEVTLWWTRTERALARLSRHVRSLERTTFQSGYHLLQLLFNERVTGQQPPPSQSNESSSAAAAAGGANNNNNKRLFSKASGSSSSDPSSSGQQSQQSSTLASSFVQATPQPHGSTVSSASSTNQPNQGSSSSSSSAQQQQTETNGSSKTASGNSGNGQSLMDKERKPTVHPVSLLVDDVPCIHCYRSLSRSFQVLPLEAIKAQVSFLPYSVVFRLRNLVDIRNFIVEMQPSRRGAPPMIESVTISVSTMYVDESLSLSTFALDESLWQKAAVLTKFEVPKPSTATTNSARGTPSTAAGYSAAPFSSGLLASDFMRSSSGGPSTIASTSSSSSSKFVASEAIAAPIQATFIKFDFTLARDRGDADRLLCPRCSKPVVSDHGVCSHCSEMVFQCRQCRNINYEDLRSFLCVQCGFCRYTRFTFRVDTRQSNQFPDIKSEKEYEIALDQLVSLSQTEITAMNALVEGRQKALSAWKTTDVNVLEQELNSVALKKKFAEAKIAKTDTCALRGKLVRYRKQAKDESGFQATFETLVEEEPSPGRGSSCFICDYNIAMATSAALCAMFTRPSIANKIGSSKEHLGLLVRARELLSKLNRITGLRQTILAVPLRSPMVPMEPILALILEKPFQVANKVFKVIKTRIEGAMERNYPIEAAIDTIEFLGRVAAHPKVNRSVVEGAMGIITLPLTKAAAGDEPMGAELEKLALTCLQTLTRIAQADSGVSRTKLTDVGSPKKKRMKLVASSSSLK